MCVCMLRVLHCRKKVIAETLTKILPGDYHIYVCAYKYRYIPYIGHTYIHIKNKVVSVYIYICVCVCVCVCVCKACI